MGLYVCARTSPELWEVWKSLGVSFTGDVGDWESRVPSPRGLRPYPGNRRRWRGSRSPRGGLGDVDETQSQGPSLPPVVSRTPTGETIRPGFTQEDLVPPEQPQDVYVRLEPDRGESGFPSADVAPE